MAEKITIIGAGPGGYVAALRAAQAGAEVTLVEREEVGGTCLNWGCIPSKVMKTSADLLEKYHSAAEFGIDCDSRPRLNLEKLMARKKEVIEGQAGEIHKLLQTNKVRFIRGEAVVKSPGAAVVNSSDGSEEISWDKLILATGSSPFELPGLPFDGKRVISSNDALTIKEIPESILVLGGGVIGCEFAFIFSSFGSQVTMVEGLDRLLPLPSVDEDCSKVIGREMKKRKMKILTSRTVERIDESGGKLRVTINASGLGTPPKKKIEPSVVEVDKVLVCIGRSANTKGLGLENAGVTVDGRGWIPVNDSLETNVPGIWAIGDVLGPSRIMLAHVASVEGGIAVENALGGNRIMNYDVTPGATFTMPEVANVGLTEAQAREKFDNVRADSVNFRNIGKAQAMGEIAGQAKIVSDSTTGRVLGVHITGPHATDLIAEGCLAVQKGLTVSDLAETIHAHPTLAEIMLETAHKAMDHPVHG